MAKDQLPWYRVYPAILDHPGYFSLPLEHKGALQVLWSLAYRSKRRGFLPSLQLCGKYLGGRYANSPLIRVKALLDDVLKEWFDYDPILDDYSVHGLTRWQYPSDDSKSRVKKHRTSKLPDDHTSVIPKYNAGQSSLLTVNDLSQNVTYPDNRGIRESIYPSNCLVHDKSLSESSPHKDAESDSRLIPLREFILQSFLHERGIKLQSICDKSDWISLNKMLKSTKNDLSCDIGALKGAWQRMLSSREQFVRKQPHPLRYWANNLGSFLIDHGRHSKQVSQEAKLQTLRACLQECPDLLSQEDRQLLASSCRAST